MDRIVVAVDGSPGAAAAVEEGIELARRLGVAVTFVTVRPPIGALGEPFYQRRLTAQLKRARTAVDSAMAEAERLGVEADYEIVEGDAVDEIVRVARYCDAGVIVAGSRGRGAVAGALLGSVSRGLTQHSPIPVLVVKESRKLVGDTPERKGLTWAS